MNKLYILLTLLIVLIQLNLRAQSTRLQLQKSREPLLQDSLYTGTDGYWHISLRPVEIVRPFVFKNNREEKKYNQLLVDVRKAFPLSQIVSSELKLVNTELDSIYKNRKNRKDYLKWYQDYVRRTYMDSLRTLNVRQGKLLLKLIHRETGKSPYTLIKEYRGGLNAAFWQTMALMLGANLHSDYDPLEDAMIENIVLRIKSGEFTP
jgi:hypothetical protein